MTIICQGLLLAAHLFNVSSLQLSSRKGVFSRKYVLIFFLFDKCLLFDIFKKCFGCFLLLWGYFFNGVYLKYYKIGRGQIFSS